MKGIITVNKPKGMTSRDVVNIVGRYIGTKKIGHTGTLDPIASGVLILVVGEYTKLERFIVANDKEYEAEIILGVLTDTLDITGNVIEKNAQFEVTEEQIKAVLSSFVKTYDQEVPLYSAIKVNGKKLYQYGRDNEEIILPKKTVTIYSLDLISDLVKDNGIVRFKIRTKVSKGTYIRSLIRDIGDGLGIKATMSDLVRTSQGQVKIDKCFDLLDIENNRFQYLDIQNLFSNLVEVNDELEFKIRNGQKLENRYQDSPIFFTKNNEIIGVYEIVDDHLIKPITILNS